MQTPAARSPAVRSLAACLPDILRQGLVWRAGELARVELPGVSTGFAELDDELPGGGWPAGVLSELLPEHEGIGEVRALGPALARLTRAGRWVAWIAPPHLPYAPALAAAGIDLARVMIVRTRTATDTLWAIEQALQSNACGAVLGWPGGTGASASTPSFAQLRRLQIAAEGSPALALLFRPPEAAHGASPAALRLHLQSLKGELAVRIVKRRGGPLARPIILRSSPSNMGAAGFVGVVPAPAFKFGSAAVPDTDHAVDRAALSLPAARSLSARLALG